LRRLYKRQIPLALLAIILLLVIARAALPHVLKAYINHTLDGIEGMYGHVDDVDVKLWRGAYVMEGVKLVKVNGSEREPFFESQRVSISIDWASVLRGRLVSEISLLKPKLQFIQRKSKAASQTSVDESWQRQVQKLYPFQINKFRIENGFVRYKDETSNPKINLYAADLDLWADNISNTLKSDDKLPSSADFNGKLLGSGALKAKAKFSMFTEPLEFDFNGALAHLDLREINNFAKAYGKFDFEKGRFDMAMELAANKTKFKGYAKTVVSGADVLNWNKDKKEGDSIGHMIWEGMAGSLIDIFENQRRDQFAARIPISGSRKEVKLDSWAAIGTILQNAFIKVISPDLEDSVEYKSSTTEKAD
jgi:hypothetical protein